MALENGVSLTGYEVQGLKSKYTFADGHAYQSMPSLLSPVLENLQSIWQDAVRTSIPDMELRFKLSFAKAARSLGLAGHEHFSICPTASNSIDISAAWLKKRNYRVGLIEPAFDNLYLLLKRRGVDVSSIDEKLFADKSAIKDAIDKNQLQSLFLVSPNNPTGYKLDKEEFIELCILCKQKNITLILDSTFRFYCSDTYDEYQIMKDTGIDFLVIEDTGKTWPTEDLKVSILSYSESVAREVREIYEEIYLCSSNFSLAFLGALAEKTAQYGVDKVVLPEVEKRKQQFRQALVGSLLHIEEPQSCTNLPLIWMRCNQEGVSDIQLVDELKKHDVVLLPGRNFYWNNPEKHTKNVRASLMRPDEMFQAGIVELRRGLDEISGNNFITDKLVLSRE